VIPIYQVDAFASEAFRGNAAVVCLLDAPCDESWMRRVAEETRAAATAFVQPAARGFALRWFTTAAELELCGHGTLATAHVLWETGRLGADEPARFETRGGSVAAVRNDGWIELDFPSMPSQPSDPPPGLIEALGASPRYVGCSRFDYLVQVESQDAVAALAPDFAALRRVATRGVIVTSRAAAGDVDFVSRFFAPSVGIDEDDVTGSAHCCLAPFWCERLRKTAMIARQLSARGGVVKVTVDGGRVRLGGQAVTVVRGELLA
jgi:PhzF family phenazine biosynthesis protein